MDKKQIENSLWVEKYRPKTIKDVLLPKTTKSYFTKMSNSGDFQNMLLYSTGPGTGKTTVAKALCSQSNLDYIYINASNTGIDILRTDIQKFAHVKSLKQGLKIVILDESDGMSPQFQSALRADIEKYYKTCRFIFTANYITKIIEPLKSRCQLVDFNITDNKNKKEMAPKIFNRLKEILKNEGVEYKDDNTLKKLILMYYPDIRKIINTLHQYANIYGYIDNNIFEYSKLDTEFYDMILNKNITSARKYLIESNYNYDELFRSLFNNFIPKLPKGQQGQAILIIAEYMYRNSFVIDKEINITAMLLEIVDLL